MDSNEFIPEAYKDAINQEFAYDPIRLPISQDPAQLLYNRRTLEIIWEAKHQAINPFTNMPFDINQAIPQVDLAKHMRSYLTDNKAVTNNSASQCNGYADRQSLRGLEVIQDYNRVLEESEMKDHLNGLVLHTHCFPHGSKTNMVENFWKALWKKLNILRLVCQYKVENRELFVSVQGYKSLFRVVNLELVNLYSKFSSSSSTLCEEAKDVYREVARIVNIIGLTERDLIKIPEKFVNALMHVLSQLRKSKYVKIQSLVLRIYRWIFHDCSGLLFSSKMELFGPYVVNVPIQLLGRPSQMDISTEDLNNGTAILKAIWAQNKFALLACNKYPQLLVNVTTLCISLYEKELQNEVEKKLQISLALEQGLWLLHKLLIKSDDNFSYHFHFDTAEKKLLSMEIVNNIVGMARLGIRGLKFDSLHLELGLSCMASIYIQRGLCVIKREDVQVLEVLLRSDEILKEYSMEVKDSIEAIVKYAGHVGVEPMEGNLFKKWIGVYALCAAAMALQYVDQK
ncbi:hypothetical protein SUGI_0173540 [Cryptomeria japonica]|uniref:uncharacterized protein LOC131078916 n=1 Tax=Cryptomeria japonica TaxID=3369 RepID=UPI002408E2D0|nr:uncharacterized protein LOC131078916 [Cryptomeria japonica]GLJ11645.1 hypothetical protein SUGI_0173540 [Cryptomeria japonica]